MRQNNPITIHRIDDDTVRFSARVNGGMEHGIIRKTGGKRTQESLRVYKVRATLGAYCSSASLRPCSRRF